MSENTSSVPTVRFAVITNVDEPETGGNMATALGSLYVTYDNNISYRPVGMEALAFGLPVFTPGEILVLDTDGRELAGRGRKPSKWLVDYETFHSIDEAVARAREISP